MNRASTLSGFLILISAIPLLAGMARLAQMSLGVDLIGADLRYQLAPVPVLVHIVASSLFCVLGAFQISGGLRRTNLRNHGTTGKIVVFCGLLSALSAIWMTLFHSPLWNDGLTLSVFRLAAAGFMIFAPIAAWLAIRARDIGGHGAWMVRFYAIGIGASTQSLLLIPYVIAFGEPSQFPRALLMGAAWVANLVIAEILIRLVFFKKTLPAYAGSAIRN